MSFVTPVLTNATATSLFAHRQPRVLHFGNADAIQCRIQGGSHGFSELYQSQALMDGHNMGVGKGIVEMRKNVAKAIEAHAPPRGSRPARHVLTPQPRRRAGKRFWGISPYQETRYFFGRKRGYRRRLKEVILQKVQSLSISKNWLHISFPTCKLKC
jgi:hypothetical protein